MDGWMDGEDWTGQLEIGQIIYGTMKGTTVQNDNSV